MTEAAEIITRTLNLTSDRFDIAEGCELFAIRCGLTELIFVSPEEGKKLKPIIGFPLVSYEKDGAYYLWPQPGGPYSVTITEIRKPPQP